MAPTSLPSPKRRLWLLLAALRDPEISYVLPTVAWMAKDAGVLFESYLESEREGRLFAETGSTVIGGHHHQQFNYLCAAFDVAVIVFGRSDIFASSLATFGLPIIAFASAPAELYQQLMGQPAARAPDGVFIGPAGAVNVAEASFPIASYLFPEVLYRRALGASTRQLGPVCELLKASGGGGAWTAFLTRAAASGLRKSGLQFQMVDQIRPDDTVGSLTLRVAQRWKKSARGVVFADPPVVLAQLASHCQHERVAIYSPAQAMSPSSVRVSHYAETVSPMARAAGDLAVEIGNREITGRQTGDGDIFEWSRRGVSIQIVDPNRPPFPVAAEVPHRWQQNPAGSSDIEPSDTQLRRWAKENRVLTSVIFHSGEVAHNEAMLALVELTAWSGLRLGLGVHAARYETCPQLWEMIGVSVDRGGARGRVEPLLHSGGLGVMAECNCPAALLQENCERALARIRGIAGQDNTPRGYYAFMDSNLDRLDRVRGDLFTSIGKSGLSYIVSSALPGRNRVLWKSDRSRCVAITQTPRVVHGCSPFVRATTAEDLQTTTGATGPGWILATLDAPVISFAPYIWRHGDRFIRLVEQELMGLGRINVTPGVIARYAKILLEQRVLPTPVSTGIRSLTATLTTTC
jgi:hypothetical protein